MRILYVGHTYTIAANQAKIAALASLPGIEVVLLTPDRWNGPLYSNKTDLFSESYSQPVRHVALRSYLTGKESGYFFGGKVFSLVRDVEPDIVHVEQGSYALSYAQILIALRKSVPTAKATFFTWWNIPNQLKGFRARLEEFNLRHSACAIAGNVEASAIIICTGFDRPIHVIPQLGVDSEAFSSAQPNPFRAEIDPETFIIGYFGRITPEKGLFDLIEAVGRIERKRPIMLYILGSGSALPELRSRAFALDINLVCHPAVRNEEVPRYLKMLDTLVLPSRSTPEWVEQFGHILIEAMASGVPVIGSSSGEIPRVIGTAGRIFPEGDVDALASLLAAFSAHPELRTKLSKLGRERVEKEFTHTRIAEKQLRVYEWMMAHGSSVGELSSRAKYEGDARHL